MSQGHSTAAQGSRGSPARCRLADASSQCCVQPGSRRRTAGGADGTISPAASAGEGMSTRNRPSRRATAEEPELSLPHWHLCDTPALGARMTGRCAWRYEQRGATRPHSQLLRRTSQLTTVRAAAPSATLPPPTPLPSGSRLLVARAPARASLRLTRFPGWAGGLMARRGAVRWAVGRLFERCTSRVSRGSLDTVVTVRQSVQPVCRVGLPLITERAARTRLSGTLLGSLDYITRPDLHAGTLSAD